MKEEAGAGIVACGAKAGERLMGVFADPKYRNFRSQIIRMWGEMNYREIAPELIALLKEHDRFWAAQDLKKGWWNDDSKPDLTHQRQVIYGEVYDAIDVEDVLRPEGEGRAGIDADSLVRDQVRQ